MKFRHLAQRFFVKRCNILITNMLCMTIFRCGDMTCGEFTMVESEPLALEPLLEVFDGSNAQFESRSEGLRLGNTIAFELEQGYQAPLFCQENFEPELELTVLDQGFLVDERVVWLNIGRGNEFKGTNQLTVLTKHQGEVGFAG